MIFLCTAARLSVCKTSSEWMLNCISEFIFEYWTYVFEHTGCIFGMVLLLQNKYVANHTPPWWYCMMNEYLPVFLNIENTINPHQISISFCRNALGLVSMSEVWVFFSCNSSMKTTSGLTSVDSRWVYQGPTGFCQFWADVTAGHLPISKGMLHASTISTFPVSLRFFKRARTAHLETPVCSEIFV